MYSSFKTGTHILQPHKLSGKCFIENVGSTEAQEKIPTHTPKHTSLPHIQPRFVWVAGQEGHTRT
jgi:hypothetical protein